MNEFNPEKGAVELMETSERLQVTRIGRLGELGLGDGAINSSLETEEQLADFEQKIGQALAEKTDLKNDGCIDGRRILRQFSGAPAEVRSRRAGASLANNVMAEVSEATVLDTVADDALVDERIGVVDSFMEDTIGKKPSSHVGEVDGEIDEDCGAALGLEKHVAGMAGQKILSATSKFVSLPDIAHRMNATAEAQSFDWLQSGVARLSRRLVGWDGQNFTKSVEKKNPDGVEVLKAAHNDTHGHQEDAIVIVYSKTRSISEEMLDQFDLGDVFVWSLDETDQAAQVLAGRKGQQGYERAALADIAFHLSVANNLCGKNMPVFFVTD